MTRLNDFGLLVAASVAAMIATMVTMNVASAADPPKADPAQTAAPMCATAAQVKQVREHYAASPGAMPAIATRTLKLPDALIASALPAEQAYGTTGAGFIPVWESLMTWDNPVTIIIKSGSVLEVRGKIGKGTPSKVSNYFNVEESGPGLGGHLRPDLVTAIYAVDLPTKAANAPLRGILFFDGTGETVFGVFAAGEAEGQPASPALVAQFEKTRSLVKSMPRVCAG
jgi:putative heme iron utilization protein